MELKDLSMRLKYMASELKERYLRQLADELTVEVIKVIQNRTHYRGLSYRLKPYSPYRSKSHIIQRRKKGLTTAIKDFYFTGNMLENIGRVKMIQQAGWIEIWIGGRGSNKRNDGSRIKNSELLAIHSRNENVNLMGLSDEEMKFISKRLNINLTQI